MRTNNIQEALGAGNDDVLSIREGPSMRKEAVNLKWSNEEYSRERLEGGNGRKKRWIILQSQNTRWW